MCFFVVVMMMIIIITLYYYSSSLYYNTVNIQYPHEPNANHCARLQSSHEPFFGRIHWHPVERAVAFHLGHLIYKIKSLGLSVVEILWIAQQIR